jgi:hypothetical protein
MSFLSRSAEHANQLNDCVRRCIHHHFPGEAIAITEPAQPLSVRHSGENRNPAKNKNVGWVSVLCLTRHPLRSTTTHYSMSAWRHTRWVTVQTACLTNPALNMSPLKGTSKYRQFFLPPGEGEAVVSRRERGFLEVPF